MQVKERGIPVGNSDELNLQLPLDVLKIEQFFYLLLRICSIRNFYSFRNSIPMLDINSGLSLKTS